MSKGFAVKNGDVIVNKTIEMVSDSENLRTKAELVISTNQGEWDLDVLEGIDYSVVLCKNPDEGEIRSTIESALKHSIDETFVVTDMTLVMEGRKAHIDFSAINADGAEIGGAYVYGG